MVCRKKTENTVNRIYRYGSQTWGGLGIRLVTLAGCDIGVTSKRTWDDLVEDIGMT